MRFFALLGEVDGQPVRATWLRGSLAASSALMRRAELLVAMDEVFETDDPATVVRADLRTALAAMLTLIRACDRVRSVRFGPAGTASLETADAARSAAGRVP